MDITEGGRPVQEIEGVKYTKMEGSYAVFENRSGSYTFVSA